MAKTKKKKVIPTEEQLQKREKAKFKRRIKSVFSNALLILPLVFFQYCSFKL